MKIKTGLKNVVLSAVVAGVLCLSTTSNARDLNKGTVEIGGDLDLTLFSSDFEPEGFDKTETDGGRLSATISYYVAKNFGIGLLLDYSSEETTFRGNSFDFKSHAIGPIVTWNFSLNEKTSFKIQGALVTVDYESSDSFGNTDGSDGFGWGIRGQISYFLTDAVSLNTSLSHRTTKLEDDRTGIDLEDKRLEAGLGLSVYLM